MEKVLYIANWKSNKSKSEGTLFFEELGRLIGSIDLSRQEIIIAPPFTFISDARKIVDQQKLPIKLSGQNVSSYPSGAYTGEINAGQLREYAEYVIIGHSERRKYLHESDSDIENKIREAQEVGLKVIQCVQDEKSLVHRGAQIIAYEPPSAIGSGNPDDPEHVEEVFRILKKQNPEITLIYGGSVSSDNIDSYKSIEGMGGFLIGGASLNANSFVSLLS